MTTFTRRLANRLERLCGVHIFRRSTGRNWSGSNFERTMFGYLRPDCIFDVGANGGQFGYNLRNFVGYQGAILSFEPNPTAFARLEKLSALDPDWHCFDYALGSETGRAKLNIMKTDVFSSLLVPGGESDKYFPEDNQVAQQIDIEIQTLDNLFPGLQVKFGFERPFLKLDTQGFDLEVVKGGQAVLPAFTGLLSEISVIPLYEKQPDLAESIAYLRACGLDLVDLFSLHPDNWFQPLLECNAYFLRRDLAQPMGGVERLVTQTN